MFSFITWEMASGILRHIITALGSLLVTWGVIDSGMQGEVVGAIMMLISVVWAAINKTQANQVKKAGAIVYIPPEVQKSVGVDNPSTPA
jgi:hypothetical protein